MIIPDRHLVVSELGEATERAHRVVIVIEDGHVHAEILLGCLCGLKSSYRIVGQCFTLEQRDITYVMVGDHRLPLSCSHVYLCAMSAIAHSGALREEEICGQSR